MTDKWYDQMTKTLQLNGKGERTQEAYLRAVRMLCEFHKKSPDVMEFIRRFLQHVLPTGFMKVRYYGFMNPNCAVSLEKIDTLIQLAYGFNVTTPEPDREPLAPMTCPKCGGRLRLLSLSLPGFNYYCSGLG